MSPSRRDKVSIIVYQKHFCVSRYKVSEVAKLEDIKGTCHVVRDLSPSSARPLDDK